MSESSQDTAPFFGFIGAASALIFSCELSAVDRHWPLSGVCYTDSYTNT
jgi:hypothetical protein